MKLNLIIGFFVLIAIIYLVYMLLKYNKDKQDSINKQNQLQSLLQSNVSALQSVSSTATSTLFNDASGVIGGLALLL